MIHITRRSHEFHYQKVLYLWEICRGSNGNIQCKITRHFLKWSTKWKRSKTMGGSALWTGLVHVTFRVYYIKIVLRVNSGILHHSLYSKTWDWTPKQSTLLLIRAILILPKNRRQLNWIGNSRVKTMNFPQAERSEATRALDTKSGTRKASRWVTFAPARSLPSFPLTDQGHAICKWISTERSVVHWTKYRNWVKNENKIYSEEYLCAWLTHSSFSLRPSASRARRTPSNSYVSIPCAGRSTLQ